MPTGKQVLIKEDIDLGETTKQLKNGKLFGCVELDLHVPESLYTYFGEMPPIFKNIAVEPTVENIGGYMQDLHSKLDLGTTKSRKLIGSMSGKQVLLGTPYIKWLLEHGVVITKIHKIIKFEGHKVYTPFVDFVSNSRREGDVDSSMAALAELAKLLGNGAAGHTLMNKRKHTNTNFHSYEDKSKVVKKINSHLYRDLDEIGSGDDLVYEIDMGKRSVKLNNPVHIGCMVY
jgi:hypothetical protein